MGQVYRLYLRTNPGNVRSIATATSKDFVKWTRLQPLKYPGAPTEQLYTNAIQPYARAPHILVGFPTRYHVPSEQVEPILMTSRDGRIFRRYSEAVIPRTAPRQRDRNRSNYMAWGIVAPPGESEKLLAYGTEAYYEGSGYRVRVFEYRVDGFVSLRAGRLASGLEAWCLCGDRELR